MNNNRTYNKDNFIEQVKKIEESIPSKSLFGELYHPSFTNTSIEKKYPYMDIEFINGDILTTNAHIVCHQVNCQGVMGAGLAKQIREKYPICYTTYKDFYLNIENKSDLLGKICVVDITNNFDKNSKNFIINLFAQQYYGSGHRYTNYEAIYCCLEKVMDFGCKLSQQYNMKIDIAFPYKLGSGLAGGNWTIIYHMIREIFTPVQDKINLKIYKYE